jgi:chromosome segregation protein
MHLKAVNLKGFKSFPDRLSLEFGPGVSVIVGPNGSGKSNITDAVLWAMGEQSPVAVRGQSMQDVIFGGGRGQQARPGAEVEIVIEADGAELPFHELSIVRKLDRSGDGEYRLNGARCRLVDVIDALSDTGLGKESHSVVSQGRVEEIVTSKPKDRRLLIEEAAGLGKHRKRRRRAQLKLGRTQDNLDRALDVEREARSRLRPLKRQAEAAEVHERLERQVLEAQWTLAREVVRSRRAALGDAEKQSVAAKAARDEADTALTEVAARREEAEQRLSRRAEEREELSQRAYVARSAGERVAFRVENVRGAAERLSERAEGFRRELTELAAIEKAAPAHDDFSDRIEALEAELAGLEQDREAEVEREVVELDTARAAAAEVLGAREAAVEERRAALATADEAAEAARGRVREAERGVEAARREAAAVGAQLAAVNQFLRSHAGAPGGASSLADALEVEPGCELALAAALGGRLGAAIVDDIDAAGTLLDGAGRDGGSAFVRRGDDPPVAESDGPPPFASPNPSKPPADGARPLADLVRGPGDAIALAAPLLAETWLVEDLSALPASFTGVAVTREGRVWFGVWRELRQVPAGGADRVLSERNRRDTLIADSERAAHAEQAALKEAEGAAAGVFAADLSRDEAAKATRAAEHERDTAAEEERRAAWRIEQRRAAPDEGPGAIRRAQVSAQLEAEKRLAERVEHERAERGRRGERARAQLARDEALAPAAERLAAALASAAEGIAARVEVLEAELRSDREAGEALAAELRTCASEEARLQATLRARGEAVTQAEVRAQQVRDQEADAAADLTRLANKLGLSGEPAEEPLDDEERVNLETRVARLERRREQLGPVNPLAKAEYAEAVEHVEELERQREDLDTAMRELEQLIADTDKQIREQFEATFTATAKHFEEIAAQLFPGGRGRLRLVREDAGPRPVLGGQEPRGDDAPADAEGDADAEAEADEKQPEEELGVEIEITPAGKSSKRLTLLSGGEKSMTALAFIFAVFLARPCPFYILDEVEAALDDLNIDRFLGLLRRYRDRAQFIVVTHQKRTMEAADTLYGVSMGDDGVSKVISRRLPREEDEGAADGAATAGADEAAA